MARYTCLLARSYEVSGHGFSAPESQFKFVQPTTNKKVIPATLGSNSDPSIVIGVSQDRARNGGSVNVALVGTTKLKAGGAVSFGDFLRPDANGEAIEHSGLGRYAAIALEDAADGDVFEALIQSGFSSTA